MTYPELRKKLRDAGFINLEIATIHMQYLCLRAGGITDDEMIFDRDHGTMIDIKAKDKMVAMVAMKVVPDVKYHCAYILGDDGTKTKIGPFT
jgi:hypothetical protein